MFAYPGECRVRLPNDAECGTIPHSARNRYASARRTPTPPFRFHQQPGPSGPMPPASVTKNCSPLFDSPESRTTFARLQLQLEASPAATPSDGGASVNEVLLAVLRFAESHSRRADGTNTNEVDEYKIVSRHPRVELSHQRLRRTTRRRQTLPTVTRVVHPLLVVPPVTPPPPDDAGRGLNEFGERFGLAESEDSVFGGNPADDGVGGRGGSSVGGSGTARVVSTSYPEPLARGAASFLLHCQNRG